MGLFDKRKSVDRNAARNKIPGAGGASGQADESGFIPFYQEIADRLEKIVPNEWAEIVMYAEAFAGMATARFYYRENKGEKYMSGGNIPEDRGVDIEIYFDPCKN